METFPRSSSRGAEEFHVFTDVEIDWRTFGIDEDDWGERALEEVHRLEYDIVYGDSVRIGNSTFRNNGVMIFDGKKLVHLEYDENIYEYGYVPKQFTSICNEHTEKKVPLWYYGISDVFHLPSQLFQDNWSEIEIDGSSTCIINCYGENVINNLIRSGDPVTVTPSYDNDEDDDEIPLKIVLTKKEVEKYTNFTTVKSAITY